MDALKIALETIIVGASALPWMFLLVDLFCPSKEQLCNGLLPQLNNQIVATIAGVLLFAMAYMVGSSVVRISEDFFNDADLSIHLTEDEIRADVFCQPGEPWLIQTGVTVNGGTPAELVSPCPHPNQTIRIEDTNNRVAQTSALEESSLWMADADKTDVLRHLRQQIVVLRGVAFNGILTTFLCLFGVCARLGRGGRWSLVVVALGLLVWAIDAMGDHFHEHMHRMAGDPPLMEIVLLAIALAGFGVAWKGVRERPYFCPFMFSALLTGLAFFGWWYTEILYTQKVIYFFYAQSHIVPAFAH